jgi:polyribonucleotide nucleotidyltransferase
VEMLFRFIIQAASSYEVKVKVFKEAYPKIIGKGGVQIRKIREETDTKIDLPRENSDSDIITITGKKENVEKAKSMIEAIQKELVITFCFNFANGCIDFVLLDVIVFTYFCLFIIVYR